MYVSWSTSELRVRLAPWNRFKPPIKFSLLTIPRWYFFCGSFVLCKSCTCLSCFCVCWLLPCGHLKGKGWSLGSCLWCLLWLSLRSHLVSWYRCGTWLYRFLILAVLLTFIRFQYLDHGERVHKSFMKQYNVCDCRFHCGKWIFACIVLDTYTCLRNMY